jgi:hypothetical protein
LEDQAAFVTVKDALIRTIAMSFRCNVATSLERMTKVDLIGEMPVPEVSAKQGKAEKMREQMMFDADYNCRVKLRKKRESIFEEEMIKAYDLIFDDFCTEEMQLLVENHAESNPNFRGDPIALLEAINVLMHSSIDPMLLLFRYMKRVFTAHQGKKECLDDYFGRFRRDCKVMEDCVGTQIFDYYIEHSEGYLHETDDSKRQQMKDEAFERLMARIYLQGSNKYDESSLAKFLEIQYTLGKDLYPKTVLKAYSVLENEAIAREERGYD